MNSDDALMAQRLAAARKILDRLGLVEWRIDITDLSHVPSRGLTNRMSTGFTRGICQCFDKTILISDTLPQHRNKFQQTVLHEAAHALVEMPGHGATWLAMAKRVGCNERELSVYRLMAKANEFHK